MSHIKKIPERILPQLLHHICPFQILLNKRRIIKDCQGNKIHTSEEEANYCWFLLSNFGEIGFFYFVYP